MIVLTTHRVYSLFRDDKKFVFDMPLFLHHNLPSLESAIKYKVLYRALYFPVAYNLGM